MSLVWSVYLSFSPSVPLYPVLSQWWLYGCAAVSLCGLLILGFIEVYFLSSSSCARISCSSHPWQLSVSMFFHWTRKNYCCIKRVDQFPWKPEYLNRKLFINKETMCNQCFEQCLLGDGNPVLICIWSCKTASYSHGKLYNYVHTQWSKRLIPALMFHNKQAAGRRRTFMTCTDVLL